MIRPLLDRADDFGHAEGRVEAAILVATDNGNVLLAHFAFEGHERLLDEAWDVLGLAGLRRRAAAELDLRDVLGKLAAQADDLDEVAFLVNHAVGEIERVEAGLAIEFEVDRADRGHDAANAAFESLHLDISGLGEGGESEGDQSNGEDGSGERGFHGEFLGKTKSGFETARGDITILT